MMMNKEQIMQRVRISALLLVLVAIVAIGVHLYLYHKAWIARDDGTLALCPRPLET